MLKALIWLFIYVRPPTLRNVTSQRTKELIFQVKREFV